MAVAIRMPALGQTTDELTIMSWLKEEGETVKVGEPLYTVETDKTTLEAESPYAGTLLKIVAAVQTMVQVGDVIAYIGKPGEAIPVEAPSQPHEAPAPTPTPAPTPMPAAAPSAPAPEGKVLATPAARQLAKERGVDLSKVKGTGPGGRIERDDVEDFV
jgi:pyruvate dehydrogenase E2 component (dihydrolipoamide acetyltransferase)